MEGVEEVAEFFLCFVVDAGLDVFSAAVAQEGVGCFPACKCGQSGEESSAAVAYCVFYCAFFIACCSVAEVAFEAVVLF